MDALTISASGRRDWNWPCLHLEGADTVNLSLCWYESEGVEYTLPTDADIVVLSYAPAEAASAENTVTVDATVDGNRLLVAEFDPTELGGVYRGVARFIDAEGVNRLTLNCIISVASNEMDGVRGAVTLADIRMHLYDRLAAENMIIENGQEFPDRLLFEGVRAAVRQWNDSDGSPNAHSPQNFVERNMLIIGASGWVLRSYRTLLARLQVPGAGQTSPETPRLQAYAAMGNELWTSYMTWMSERMRMEDADAGWGYA